MTDELRKALERTEGKVDDCKREAGDKGHTALLLMVFIIFLRGC